MARPQYLLYALLAEVVFSLVHVLLTTAVEQAVAGVVVGTVLSLLANLISGQITAADAARRQRTEREITEAPRASRAVRSSYPFGSKQPGHRPHCCWSPKSMNLGRRSSSGSTGSTSTAPGWTRPENSWRM